MKTRINKILLVIASMFVIQSAYAMNIDFGSFENTAKISRLLLAEEDNSLEEDLPLFFGGQGEPRRLFFLKFRRDPIITKSRWEVGKLIVNPSYKAEVLIDHEEALRYIQKKHLDVGIIYQYAFILNGFAIYATKTELDAIKKGLPNIVQSLEKPGTFNAPEPITALVSGGVKYGNSVNFIGSEKAWNLGHQGQLLGQGMRVGVIDSGIDYTHKMFAGPGSRKLFTSLDPRKRNAYYPNKKVTGGKDIFALFVNPQSKVVDENPIDETGHGTHVAGTIGGLGDGVETHDGVAPEAQLHSLKVFGIGRRGTSELMVAAALEYAIDPNEDGNTQDRLHVVNLSLGSPFGIASRFTIYSDAIKNASKAGVAVVAAAGNDGNQKYIVSSPSVYDDAFSVAASVDGSPRNTNFPMLKVYSGTQFKEYFVFQEGSNEGVSLNKAPKINEGLVYVGIGKNLTPAQQKALKGKVALVDRGEITFYEKTINAQKAGAIAVIVANNQPGETIAMGMACPSGQQKCTPVLIPAVMISKSNGDTLKAQMKTSSVKVHLAHVKTFTDPRRIDQVASFSSSGLRIFDYALKPEISAPGEKVLSAQMGAGAGGVLFNGTSMAAPHMAGAMTLMMQQFPRIHPKDLKNILMSTSKILTFPSGKRIPLSRQGAGRVQLDKAVVAKVLLSDSAISLGRIDTPDKVKVTKTITIRNLTNRNLSLQVKATKESGSALKIRVKSSLDLKPRGEKSLSFQISVSPKSRDLKELSDFVEFYSNGQKVAHIPAITVARKTSQIKVSAVNSVRTATGGEEKKIEVRNASNKKGTVLPFYLLGTDPIESAGSKDPLLSCDLTTSGVRYVKDTKTKEETLQVVVVNKVENPFWSLCTVGMNIVDQKTRKRIEMGGVCSPNGDCQTVLAGELKTDLPSSLTGGRNLASSTISVPLLLRRKSFMNFNAGSVFILEAKIKDIKAMFRVLEKGKLDLTKGTLSLGSEVINLEKGDVEIEISQRGEPRATFEFEKTLSKMNKKAVSKQDIDGAIFIPALINMLMNRVDSLEVQNINIQWLASLMKDRKQYTLPNQMSVPNKKSRNIKWGMPSNFSGGFLLYFPENKVSDSVEIVN